MNEGKQEGWKSSRNTRKAVWWRRVPGADSTGGGEPEEGAGRLDAGEPGQQPSLRQIQDDARTTRRAGLLPETSSCSPNKSHYFYVRRKNRATSGTSTTA